MDGPAWRHSAIGAALLAVLVASACREGVVERPAAGSPPPAPAPAMALGRGPGIELERTLAGPDADRFSLALAVDDYFELVVEQRGVDLVLSLHEPGGQLGLVLDTYRGADGAWGPERLCWLAREAGTHEIQVRSVARQMGGTYAVRLVRVGPATSSERARAAAELAFAAADRAAASAGEVGRAQGIAGFRQAAAAFLALGEAGRQADSLFRAADLELARGDSATAIAAYDQALALYRGLGDRRQVALTLHHRGFAFAGEDSILPALADFEAALPIWREVGDRRGEALSSNELGRLHRFLGEGSAALAAYDRALAAFRALGDQRQQARILHNRGRLYLELGAGPQALTDLRRALRLRRALGRPDEVASTLNSLGQLYALHDDAEAARLAFEEALRVSPDPAGRSAAMSLAGLGRLAQARGELATSRDALFRAREIFEADGDLPWRSFVVQELGRLAAATGDEREAAASFAAAREGFLAVRDRASAAGVELELAELERRAGRWPAARQRIEAAIAEVEDLRAGVAASPEIRAGFFATRQHFYDALVDLLLELERREPGAGHAAAALAVAERARARSLLEMLERRPADRGAPAASGPREALRALERRINAAELRRIHLASTAAPGWEVEERSLAAAQGELLRERERLRDELEASSPAARRGGFQALGAADLARLLDEKTLLLEVRLGESRSTLWVVSHRELVALPLPPRAELERLARQAHGLLADARRQSRLRAEQVLAELSRHLLVPAAAKLAGKTRIALVPDGALELVPFAALPSPLAADGGAPLIARFEVSSLPSVSTLATLRASAAGRPSPPGLLAVVADPLFDASDPRLAARGLGSAGGQAPGGTVPAVPAPATYRRLRHAGDEAAALLALAPAGLGFAATGAAAERGILASGKLAQYRIVHFATHGDLDAERPELSRLVLSQVDAAGRPRDDGLLYAYEIVDLELPVELVVLSACRTALGRTVRGEGLMGLARSFMHAGAQRVMTSLWDVGDRSTSELMTRFYRHLLQGGKAPSAALRAAQNELRQDPRFAHPVFWAGFVLQGDWQDLPRRDFRQRG